MATNNLSVAISGVFPLLLSIASVTADVTAAKRLKLPFPAKLLAVSGGARAKSGTTPTLAVDVKAGGVSVLTAPVAFVDGSVTEASIDSTKAQIADEAEITIDLDVGGTTPNYSDVDILLTFVRI